MILRDYQQSILNQIINDNADVVFQLETGAGKTAIINCLASSMPTVTIAHRNMLIEQISKTHSKSGLAHQIIGSPQITKRCQLYQRKNGVECAGNVWVGTIQSIVSRYKKDRLNVNRLSIEQVIIDEVHHLANGNMWHQVKDIFPNARFIGATATPCRLDGKGLHKNCGGLFEKLIQADQLKEKSTKWLIANNYLCDYEAWCPPTEVDFNELTLKNKCDFTYESIENALKNKKIIGDVITNYRNLADNKKTIIYCHGIHFANVITKKFKEASYSAAYIASNLSFTENMRRLDAFRNDNITVLVNVEMATEGFDLPESECLIMLRPTASLVLYKQMVGRVFRKKVGDSKAILIDHVGNILRHGLPDDDITWSLVGYPSNKKEPVINCKNCGYLHNAFLELCPKCNESNWMRNTDATTDNLVKAQLVDINLIRKVRDHFEQKQIELQKQQERDNYQKRLKTQVIIPRWRDSYGGDAVGRLCTQITDWFLTNLELAGVDYFKINEFTTGERPTFDFWSSYFTIKDLAKNNPEKCKRALHKWLSK